MAKFTPIIHKYTTPKHLTVNVFLVETENGVVIIDSATAISSSHEIRGIIDKKIKKPILAILLTHAHPDHYVGAGEIIKGLDIPIYATQGAIDFAHYQDEKKFDTTIRNNYGDDAPEIRVFPNKVVVDDEVLKLNGVEFRIQDLGPCESDADSIWSININGVKHLFIGDIVYNHIHGYFRDGHALNWMAKLDMLIKEYDHTTKLYPAHGEICGVEMFYWQKAYIQTFLGTVKSLVNGGSQLNESGKQELIRAMKSFLPNEKLIFLMQYELDETIEILKEKSAI